MDKQPLISVVTPCYNGGRYLPDYFRGILDQKHRNIELIFVDDGSTDDTASVAAKFGERLEENGMRFRYIRQEHLGQAAAINRGLAVCQGEYLTWLDADDIMLPENLSKKLAYLEEHPDCGFVFSEAVLVDADDPGRVIGRMKRVVPAGDDPLFSDLIERRNVVWGPGTVLVRRSCMDEAFPSRRIYESREGQNIQLLLPLAFLFRCGYVGEALLQCVLHTDSHSRQRRSLKELLAREEGILENYLETIKTIPRMTAAQRALYGRQARIAGNRFNAMNAGSKWNYGKFRRYARLLKNDGYFLSREERFWMYIPKRIKNWHTKLKRILNRG